MEEKLSLLVWEMVTTMMTMDLIQKRKMMLKSQMHNMVTIRLSKLVQRFNMNSMNISDIVKKCNFVQWVILMMMTVVMMTATMMTMIIKIVRFFLFLFVIAYVFHLVDQYDAVLECGSDADWNANDDPNCNGEINDMQLGMFHTVSYVGGIDVGDIYHV